MTLQLTSDQWYDVLRSSIAAFGLVAAGGAAFLAYRRQCTSEAQRRISAAQQRTADDQHRLERQRHDLIERVDFRDRYAKAAEQLGHAKPAVRLAGVYVMAQLADDWGLIDVAQRQVCIDVLCACIRMPYAPEKAEPGEEQVRLTLISVVRQHVQDPDTPTSWCRADLDFTGATFTGQVSFGDAGFYGERVFFDRAKFSGGTTFFDGATFNGQVFFDRAEFSGGTVSFVGAGFSGGRVSFLGAGFSGGEVSFGRAVFSGGTVSFDSAVFSGGKVFFDRAGFSGCTVSFFGAGFSGGAVNFARVRDWSRPPNGLPDSPCPGLTLPSMPRAADETA